MTNPFLNRLNTIYRGSRGLRPPSILFDGNTVGWYDYKKLVTKDGSDLVSVWGDRSGLNHDLLQAIGTNQPLWTSANGILFDGIDNFLKAVGFTFVQPEMIYIVLKSVAWVSNRAFFDGDSDLSGTLWQRTATPNISAYVTTDMNNGNLVIGAYSIIRVLFDGLSSKLQVNETTAVIGNTGTGNPMSGFTLGSRGSTTGGFSNIQVKEIIKRKIIDTSQDDTDIYNYLKKHNGL